MQRLQLIWKATVNSYLKSNPLEELMRVNSDGKKCKNLCEIGR